MENNITSPSPKKRIPKWLRVSLYLFGGFFVLLLVVGIFAPKPKDTGATASADKPEVALTGVALIKSKIQDALPSGCKFYYDSVEHDAECQWHCTETFWDENDLVRKHFSKGIEFGKAIFQAVPDLRTVTMITYTKMTDVDGNEKDEKVLEHTFAREPFLQIHWDKFEFSPIVLQLTKAIKGDGYMHPGVAKNVDLSKIYYKP